MVSRLRSLKRSIEKRIFGRGLILLYHSVVDNPFNNSGLHISTRTFADQVTTLKKRFPIISLNELLEGKFGVAITFDDGYANNLYSALPVLEKLEIEATIFTTTMWLDKPSIFWWDKLSWIEKSIESDESDFSKCFQEHSKQLMSLDQAGKDNYINRLLKQEKYEIPLLDDYRTLTISELVKLANHPLITIGGHTHSHLRLPEFPIAQQYEDIILNMNKLKELLNQDITLFAYPHGGKTAINSEGIDIVKKVGYRAAFTAYSGFYDSRSDKWAIPRVHVGNISGIDLVHKLNHWL